MSGNACLDGIRFPDGYDTGTARIISDGAPLRLRNARVARSLDLAGKRVLDVGCGLGLYSLYMADSAAEVVGVDHQATRIATAEDTRRKLGYSNVRFVVDDIRDPGFFDRVGKFDLVVAWGFLHRIPDIFSPLYNLSAITDAFSLEWSTPVFFGMSRAVAAYHRPEVNRLDPTNLAPLGTLSPEDLSRKKIGGFSGYWFPTPVAVATLLRKCGYGSSRVLGYGENLMPEKRLLLRHLARSVRQRRTVTYERVHMIVERSAGSIAFNSEDMHEFSLPEWDAAGRAYLQRRG